MYCLHSEILQPLTNLTNLATVSHAKWDLNLLLCLLPFFISVHTEAGTIYKTAHAPPTLCSTQKGSFFV